MPLRIIISRLQVGLHPLKPPLLFADGAANIFDYSYVVLQFYHRDNTAAFYVRALQNTEKEKLEMSENHRPDGRVISIRLLSEEVEILTAKAKEANMSKARFLKNVLIYGGAYEKTNFTSDDTRQLGREIDRISTNLSQISARAYGSKDIDIIDFLKLRDNYFGLLTAFFYFIHGKGDK